MLERLFPTLGARKGSESRVWNFHAVAVSGTSAVGIGAPERRAGCAIQLWVTLPPFPLVSVLTMSCCGSPRPQTPLPQTAVSKSVHGGTLQQFSVSHQPTAHPGPYPGPAPEMSPFRPPNIMTPEPVHSMSHLNGYQSPPPTSSTVHGSIPPSPPSTGPQVGMFNRASVVDPIGSLSPLRRPSPAYPASGNPNLLSTYPSAAVPSLPPPDEGKMSISIDFGERRSPESHPTPRSN